jgi:hypothetical protein
MRNLSTPLGLSKFDGDDKKKKGTQKKQTPFQDYMQNPGAVASDTTSRTVIKNKIVSRENKLGEVSTYNSEKISKQVKKAKNPANQKALQKANEATYGERSLQGIRTTDCNYMSDSGACYDSYRKGTSQFKKSTKDYLKKSFDNYAREYQGYSGTYPVTPYTKESKSAITAPARKSALKKSKMAPSGTQKRRDQYDARGWKQDKTTAIRKKK